MAPNNPRVQPEVSKEKYKIWSSNFLLAELSLQLGICGGVCARVCVGDVDVFCLAAMRVPEPPVELGTVTIVTASFRDSG